jgi:hypothetical protein
MTKPGERSAGIIQGPWQRPAVASVWQDIEGLTEDERDGRPFVFDPVVVAERDEATKRFHAERRAREVQVEAQLERDRRRRLLDRWGAEGWPVERFEEVARIRELVALGAPVREARVAVSPNPIETDALDRVRRHSGGLLVLGGKVGLGKTGAAVWWMAQPGPCSPFLELGPPRFLLAVDIERIDRFGSAKEWAALERARRLVIDDLGLEYQDGSGSILGKIDALVNKRAGYELDTIATCNMEREEFVERYRARITDRMWLDDGGWHDCKGHNLRREQRKARRRTQP